MDYETLRIVQQNTQLAKQVRQLSGQLEFSNESWDKSARANYWLSRKLHWYQLLSKKRKDAKKCKNQNQSVK